MEFSLAISIFAGVIAAPVISFLKSQEWSAQVKQAAALGVSFAVAGLSLLLSGELADASWDTWEQVGAQIGVVFAASQVFYAQYFKSTGLNDSLEQKGVQ